MSRVDFDEVFLDALDRQVPQLVLLGAGYDSRAYRFAGRNRATRIIELDLAATQDRKRRLLAGTKTALPERVSLVPIDFNREDLGAVLAEKDFDSQLETLFIWEGVSYYLQPEAMATALEFVGRWQNTGSRIAFDYAVTITDHNRGALYGVDAFLATWEKHRQGEPFKASIEAGGLGEYLRSRGLKLVRDMAAGEIERTYLPGDQGESPGPVAGLFGFAVASPDGGGA